MKRHDIGVRNFARLLGDLRRENTLGPILDVSMRDACGVYGVAAPDHVRPKSSRPVRYPEATTAPGFIPQDWQPSYEQTLNVASHDINLLRMLFGNQLAAQAFSVWRDRTQMMLFDAGGFPVRLTVIPADLGRWDQRLDVTFARGRASLILASPLERERSARIILERGGTREVFDVAPTDHVWAFEAQAQDFVDAIASGRKPECSGAACLADIALIEDLWKKAELR
jgi:predicted dehydrogenase